MTKTDRKPRTAKGAVLIMVLTVMFVLIFLLAGTVAVVYSTNNRVLQKFEQSQAYYTARSVMDTYIDTLLHDNNNDSSVPYYYIDGTTLSHVPAKQGRALELDLYDLACDLNAVIPGVQAEMPTASNITDVPDWVAEYIIYLATDGMSIDDYISANSITVPATQTKEAVALVYLRNHVSGTDFQSIIDLAEDDINPSDDAGVKSWDTPTGYTDPTPYGSFGNFYEQFEVTGTDTVVYNVPKGTMANYGEQASGDSFGTVVSDINNLNTEDAKITVKVLERKYHMGEYSDKYNFKARFDGGIREKDYIKIQINCEINWNGVPTTTSAIYMTVEQSKAPSSKAITSLSDIASGTSIRAYGGASSLSTKTANWTNNSGGSDDFYLQGGIDYGSTDFSFVSNSKTKLLSRSSMRVGANSPSSTYMDSGTTFITKGYINDGNGGFGDDSHYFNLVTKDFLSKEREGSPSLTGRLICENYAVHYKDSGKPAVKGDVYCNYLVLSKKYVDVHLDGSTAHFYVNYTNDNNDNAFGNNAMAGNESFTNSVVTGTDGTTDGKIHVAKGIMLMDNEDTDMSITGGNVVLNTMYKDPADPSDVYGEITDGETITIGSNTYTVAIDWTNMSNYASLGTEVKVDYEAQDTDKNSKYELTEQDFTYEATSGKKTFALPAPLLGSGETNLILDTPKSLYKTYFMSAATSGGTYDGEPFDMFGDLNAQKRDADETNYDPNAYFTEFGDFSGTNANFAKFIEEHIDPPSNRNTNVNRTSLTYTAPKDISSGNSEVQTAAAAVGAAGYYDSDFVIPSREDFGSGFVPGKDGNAWNNEYKNKVFIIDTTSGAVDVQVGNGDGGEFGGKFCVVGNNDCNILMPGKDGVTVKYNLGQDSTFNIFDYDLGEIPTDLYLGSNSPTPTEAPNIYYYCADNVDEVFFGQNTTVMAGYIYAPHTLFGLAGGNNGRNINIHVDTKNCGQHGISVIGSIFCKGYTSNQTVGVAFIDPGNTSTNPGERLFGWTDVLYTRGA